MTCFERVSNWQWVVPNYTYKCCQCHSIGAMGIVIPYARMKSSLIFTQVARQGAKTVFNVIERFLDSTKSFQIFGLIL